MVKLLNFEMKLNSDLLKLNAAAPRHPRHQSNCKFEWAFLPERTKVSDACNYFVNIHRLRFEIQRCFWFV